MTALPKSWFRPWLIPAEYLTMIENRTNHPHWQRLYQDAVSESQSRKLPEKIHAAEQAIFERLQNLPNDSAHETERQAIADAVAVLRKLLRDRLSFPDWNI
jgi:hypothetical protein